MRQLTAAAVCLLAAVALAPMTSRADDRAPARVRTLVPDTGADARRASLTQSTAVTLGETVPGELVARAVRRLRAHVLDLDRDIYVLEELAEVGQHAIESLVADAGRRIAVGQLEESLAALAREGDTRALISILAADAAHPGQSPIQQSRAYLALGAVAYADDPQEAVGAYRSAVALDPTSTDAWRQLGHALRPGPRKLPHEDGAGAMDAYRRVLDMGTEREDPIAQASAHGGIGFLMLDGPELPLAEAHFTKALALERALGREALVADLLRNLGVHAQARGELESAETHYFDSLAIDEALDRAAGIARTRMQLASLYLADGNLERAEGELRAAAEIAEAAELRRTPLRCYAQLGDLYAGTGRLRNAARVIERAIELAEALGHREELAGHLAELGLVHQMHGNGAQAARAFARARDLYRQLGQERMAARMDAMLEQDAVRARLERGLRR